MRRHLLPHVSLVLLILLALGGYSTPGVHAQTPAITYERYDTHITLQPDGTFLVREIQQIRFDDEFHTAFADIPRELTTAIRQIQLYEGDLPYTLGGSGPRTFTTEEDSNFIYVQWEYEPTAPGDVRTFVLEYEVVGGLWRYPNETLLEWRAVPADRGDIVVESSTVTVTLPTTVAPDQIQSTAYGPSFQTATQATDITFTATEPIPDGVQFQIQVGLPSDLVNAERQPWQVQEDHAQLDYAFKALNVELTLEPDGVLWVDEYHHLAVNAGALDQGNRQLPLRFLDTIDQIQLQEGQAAFVEATSGCTYCLQIRTTPGQDDWAYYDPTLRTVVSDTTRVGTVQLTWQFPPLVRGEETSLHLRYRVQGAVRHLADRQEINWTAVFPARNQPVEQAQLRFTLPTGVDAQTVQVSGGTSEWVSAETVLVTAPGPIAAGQAWAVQISLPVNATTGAIPQWQQDLADAVIAGQAAALQQARLQLGFGVAALLILVLGLLGVYLIWYWWGRDRPLPAIADYLTEPPSHLPPAIVAYLLDEAPSVKGALASLFHLAQWGLLWIRFDNTLALKRVAEKKLVAGEALITPSGESVTLPAHLVTLFNAIEPDLPYETEVPLHQIYRHFQAVLPQVYAQMGSETSHFFDDVPEEARHRWLVRGQWFILLGVIGGVILALRFFGDLGWLALAPAVSAVLAGFALVFASRWMPRRTTAGVEEAQRWRAFRTYLQNLKKYGDAAQAQRILDRYFAYAVALDVEEVVLEQATEMGGMLPDWSYTPTWQPPRRPVQRREQPSPYPTGGSIGLPTPSAPAAKGENAPATRPSLSGTSRQLGNALSNASQSLGSLLSTATGSALPDTPFENVLQGAQTTGKVGAKVASTTLEILGAILEESSSGGGSGGYSSSGSSRSSWSSSSSRSRSSSSRSSSGGFSSSRSSSSRRSGGGGRRGFG
ncbi:MAG: DUF2207 domain-containing protein [Caldilineaceae bacterium]|nr:DUF2207 domain-containing protein [Caldilineaceae bacterium]